MKSIILIGGPPGAGKTTLAQALAERLGRKNITMDDLVVAARAVTSQDSHPSLFPAAGQNYYEYFTNSTPEKLITDSQALADAVWPIVERTVRYHLGSKTELVMDYWLFEPRRVASLEPEVAVLWLHIDPAALEIRERAIGWSEGSADPQQMHQNFMARSMWRNSYLAEEATKLGQPVLDLLGTESVEQLVESALALME